ncbi:MAG: hypothetical protein J6333_06475 [Planctomycetes bacterium]|nr:hypothetical protein [Planctomycetota bacterium]
MPAPDDDLKLEPEPEPAPAPQTPPPAPAAPGEPPAGEGTGDGTINVVAKVDDAIRNLKSDGRDLTADFDPADIAANRTVAALAYLGPLFFVPMLLAPQSKFANFHANQGVVLCLSLVAAWIVVGMAVVILLKLPLIGFPFAVVLGGAGLIAAIAMMVAGVRHASAGRARELPLIGRLRILAPVA